jgi:hypothetical protein
LTFRTLEAFEVFPELASEAAAVSSRGFCSTRGIGVFFPTEISADGMSGLLVAPNEQEYPAKPELIVFRIRTVGLLSIPE